MVSSSVLDGDPAGPQVTGCERDAEACQAAPLLLWVSDCCQELHGFAHASSNCNWGYRAGVPLQPKLVDPQETNPQVPMEPSGVVVGASLESLVVAFTSTQASA